MSGLISSLLIVPVVRQARRLSQQTDPPLAAADTHLEQTTNVSTPTTLNDNGAYNDDLNVIMSDFAQRNQRGAGSYGRYEVRDDGPSSSPTSTPIDETGQHYDIARFSQPGTDHARRSWNNPSNQAITERPGSIRSLRDTPTSSSNDAPISTLATDTMHSTNPSTRQVERYPNSNVDVCSPGAHLSLPEDDGMGILRKRIHAIRDLQSSNTDKARMIHDLMTENYNASRAYLSTNTPLSPPFALYSPRSSEPADSLTSRWSEKSFYESSMIAECKSPESRLAIEYNLTAEDLKPTFAPIPESDTALADEDPDTEEVEETQLGCQHYKRNVKLQCHACKSWYTCRFCHDEIEDHTLDRPRTENMLCMLCGHPQPAAQVCQNCGGQAAQYYCNTCKLWDNDSHKSIYHCTDCGICRIGQGLGKDFFHCKTCCVCLPMSIEKTHRCIERSTQCNCPICGEYMFTSPETVVFMRCSHSIHQKCLSKHSDTSYRCPICSKTIRNMESTFRNLDRSIESQPMPSEFRDTKALVHCNDCGTKSVVKYHWLGLKCDMCESYNTAQIRLLHGDTLNTAGQETALSRMRSSSHSVNDATSALTAFHVNTSDPPNSNSEIQISDPSSTETGGQFASYNLTRGRAISPVISNYFGIPPDRGSERSRSASFFGGRTPIDNENDDQGEVRFWGTKFKYRYGFLSRETDSADGASGSDEEVDDDVSEASDTEDENEDDEDDDEDERIDIIGHR